MSAKNLNEVYYGNLSFIFEKFSPLMIPSYQRDMLGKKVISRIC